MVKSTGKDRDATPADLLILLLLVRAAKAQKLPVSSGNWAFSTLEHHQNTIMSCLHT